MSLHFHLVTMIVNLLQLLIVTVLLDNVQLRHHHSNRDGSSHYVSVPVDHPNGLHHHDDSKSSADLKKKTALMENVDQIIGRHGKESSIVHRKGTFGVKLPKEDLLNGKETSLMMLLRTIYRIFFASNRMGNKEKQTIPMLHDDFDGRKDAGEVEDYVSCMSHCDGMYEVCLNNQIPHSDLSLYVQKCWGDKKRCINERRCYL